MIVFSSFPMIYVTIAILNFNLYAKHVFIKYEFHPSHFPPLLHTRLIYQISYRCLHLDTSDFVCPKPSM